MRNELKPRDTDTPYYAMGKLDDCDASIMAFGGGSIVVGFGLGSISLTRSAAAELVKHLAAALEAVGGVQ